MPRRLAAAVLVAALLFTAACGDPESTDEAPLVPTEITEVNVGVIPIVDVAPIFLGREKGFFRERGIDLKMELAQGGAVIVPGVVSGQYQFGFSNVISLMIAQSKNVPIQAVASGVASTGESNLDFGAVVVLKNSNIKNAADLAGKKVAVNTVKNIAEITVRQAVRNAGADPTSVKPVEIPFPDMVARLEAKDVDAAMVVEPFLAQARGAGHRVVSWNFAEAAPNLTVSAYFTNTRLAQQEPDLVRRFTEGINESMRYANAHPDLVRGILPSYMKISDVLLAGMTLPNWPSEINRDSVETLAQASKDFGVFGDAQPDLNKLLPST
jgi:NitT/TauT family transport system substrate-binding protein